MYYTQPYFYPSYYGWHELFNDPLTVFILIIFVIFATRK